MRGVIVRRLQQTLRLATLRLAPFGHRGIAGLGLAALTAFTASTLLALGVSGADAATMTINFAGTVTAINDPSHETGLNNIGDTFSATLTFDPLNFTPLTSSGTFNFQQSSGTFTLGANTVGGAGSVQSVLLPASPPFPGESLLLFQLAGPDGGVSFDFAAGGSSAQLTSLSQLPTDLASLATYFGTSSFIGGGGGTVLSGNFDFDVTGFSVATTPIPPSLLLFVSALGGLGFVAWRRQTRAVIPSQPAA